MLKHYIDLSKEDGHQYALILWTQQASIRAAHPELALLFHIENERQCTPQEAARRKRLGVKSGVPDLFLPVARQGYNGLWIELKTPKGKPSDKQKWWLEHLTEQGYLAKICYGWEEAKKTLEEYLK